MTFLDKILHMNNRKLTITLLLTALLAGGNAHAGVVVNGNVYGGGNAADVLTNSTVNIIAGKIGGDTIDTDHGNVFGGGKGQNTVVQGNVEVNIGKDTDGNYSGTGIVKGSVYGGSAFGAVNAKKENNTVVYSGTNASPAATHVNIFSGTINDCVYGGGLGQTSPDSIAAQSFGDVTITMEGGSVANGVFGGSNVNGYLLSNATVTIKSGTIGSAPEQGDPIADVVFGGGFGKPTRVAGNVRVNIGIQNDNTLTGDAIIYGNVYGGSAKGYVNGTTVSNNTTTTQVNLNKGTVIGDIYGGGLGYIDISDNNTNDAEANVYGKVNVNVNDGTARDVFGCNNINGAPQQDVRVTINNTNATGITNVYGGGNKADMPGTVTVDINGGTITGDVYGGGALANTNTSYMANNAITTQSITTQVNLKGGTIKGNVYGGGLGQIGSDSGGGTGTGSASTIDSIPAYVYGNILVELNPGQSDACVIEGNIFGCNNQNGTPLGTVTVHVHRTHGWTDHDVTAGNIGKTGQTYELAAVYGGGDLAAYEPFSVLTSAPDSTCVIIDGCDETSIGKVYGGGNAASTPATCVIINGTYEIGEVFGGGNGKDSITINGTPLENPGANVGYKAYPEEYGSGKAQVKIYGGTIHTVYGGSDTKGNIREEAVTLLDDLDENTCTFNVDQVYGGGKNAPLDGNIVMEMQCIPGLNSVYGGSDNADVNGDVTLNITNGKFLQVFGGNNRGGRVNGSITINIEETGCQPIIIGELYGGGNEAPYSIYGYYYEKKEETVDGVTTTTTILKPRPSLDYSQGSGPAIAYDHPQVNIKSFTSIGNVFGGGYGEKAEMVGNPNVNINVGYGKYYNSADYAGETLQIDQNNSVTTPGHTPGEIGAIGTVFGGGNAAKVTGETYVNIGDKLGENIKMETGEEQTILVRGADIKYNVYGGGNNAEVTGGTHVQIGPTPTNPAPPVNNNNGGDDDGDSGDSDNIGNNSQPVPQRDTRNSATEQLLNRTVTPIRQ